MISRAYAISLGDSSNRIYHHRSFHFSFRTFNYSSCGGDFLRVEKDGEVGGWEKRREKRGKNERREQQGNMHNVNPARRRGK